MPEAEDAYVQGLAEEIAAKLAVLLDQRPLLTLDQTAEALGIGRRTVNTLITEGELKVVNLRDGGPKNKLPRIERAEIDRFVARRRESADDQT